MLEPVRCSSFFSVSFYLNVATCLPPTLIIYRVKLSLYFLSCYPLPSNMEGSNMGTTVTAHYTRTYFAFVAISTLYSASSVHLLQTKGNNKKDMCCSDVFEKPSV